MTFVEGMRRKAALFSAVLEFAAMSAFGGEVDLGIRTNGTPYDPYLGPVRQVYSGLSDESPSIDAVRDKLRTARRYRYFFDPENPYTPAAPEVTEAREAGDCKAKSLWLVDKLGFAKTRYVIGIFKKRDRLGHVWCLLEHNGDWLILDPTWESDVVLAKEVVGQQWIARYSFCTSGAFKHATYSTYMGNQNPTPP